MSWLSAIVLWALTAGAAELYFEGPVHEVRGDAIASSRAARDAGHKTRVVRRYRDGAGWEYLVRVSGFDDKASALQAAPVLIEALGGEVALYRLGDPDAQPEQIHFVPGKVPEAEAEAAPEPGKEGEGATVSAERELNPLWPSVEAHGGADGGAAKIRAADRVKFVFRRTLGDGAVIAHTWARQGDALYARIEKVEGDVTPSRTLVTADGAWLAVADGPLEAQDRERTLETLTSLSPERVVPFVLSFAEMVDDRKELQVIHEEDETVELDGRTMRVLRSEGDQASGPLVIHVSAKSDLVRKVDFDDGALVVQFDDWKEMADAPVRVPRSVRTWKEGALVDTVEILEIDLEPELPKAWFEAP